MNHAWMLQYPQAALVVDGSGVVRFTNGRLDAMVDRPLTGSDLAAVLDTTSQAKWCRILAQQPASEPVPTWELVVVTPSALEVRNFLALRTGDGDEAETWLLEQADQSRLAALYTELAELNEEVIDGQRKLSAEGRRLARALAVAENAVSTRDNLLAVVSHDLRNPVNTILMATGVLDLLVSDPIKASHLAMIRRAGASMKRLIADLLDASAIQSGTLAMQQDAVSVEALLDDVVRAFASAAEARQVTLASDAAATGEVTGDAERLAQALGNIVDNAIRYAPIGGVIDIGVVRGDSEITISVADQGPGIPEHEMELIFDRFWHASRERHGGTGLGLSIAKGIVAAHGGRIWVEPNQPSGSVFRVAIPILTQ